MRPSKEPLLALLAAVVFLSASCAHAGSIEVVLAHYQEDVTWIHQYRNRSDVRFTVYTKAAPVPETTQHLPNVGRESHTYLHHIVEHYDTLAPWTVFMQGARPFFGYRVGDSESGHLSDGLTFDDYLDAYKEGAESFFILSAVSHFPSERQSTRLGFLVPGWRNASHDTCPRDGVMGWTPWWRHSKHPHRGSGKYFLHFYRNHVARGADLPEELDGLTMAFAQGAVFAVSRDRIRMRPKSYYEDLIRFVNYDPRPIEGYFMEASWYDVFHPDRLQAVAAACKYKSDNGPVLTMHDVYAQVRTLARQLRTATSNAFDLNDLYNLYDLHDVDNVDNNLDNVDGETSSPTSSPTPVDGETSSPTSSPTPVDGETPSPTPVDPPAPSPTPVDGETLSRTPVDGETPSPTPVDLPSPSPTPVDGEDGNNTMYENTTVDIDEKMIAFTMRTFLTAVSDFDADTFLEAMASELGVPVGDVSMAEATFAITTVMTFATVLTKEEVRTAVAKANEIMEKYVEVATEALGLADGKRRLATNFVVTIDIPVVEDGKATSIMESIDDVGRLASALGLSKDDVSVKTPILEVKFKVVVKTTKAEAVEPPSIEAFATALKENKPTTHRPSTTTTNHDDDIAASPNPVDNPDSGAFRLSALVFANGATLAALLAAVVSVA